MGEILVGDIETNGLKPSLIWMVGILNVETDEYTDYIGDDEVPIGLMRLAEADLIIGHNFRGYDAPVIKRLTDGLIDIAPSKIEDTVDLGRKLFPTRKSHKLASWGEEFGYPKLDYTDFERWSETMRPYCERDVRLNKVLYDYFIAETIIRETK